MISDVQQSEVRRYKPLLNINAAWSPCINNVYRTVWCEAREICIIKLHCLRDFEKSRSLLLFFMYSYTQITIFLFTKRKRCFLARSVMYGFLWNRITTSFLNVNCNIINLVEPSF